MIMEVEIKNWRSHAHTRLKFPEGTNVLVGPNGSGKTSVLSAIEFALFGTTSDIASRRLKLDDVIRRGQERGEVEVRFVAPDGAEYIVKRVLVRGKGTTWAELRKADGGTVISGSAESVTEKVSRILKISRDVYERAIYSEQNRLDYLLELSASDRKNKIDELLGISKFENVRKSFGSLARELEGSAEDLKRKIKDLKKEELLQRLESLEKKAEEMRALLREKKLELEGLSQKLNLVQAERSKLEKLREEISSVQGELGQLRGRIEQGQSQLKKMKEELGKLADVPPESLRAAEEKKRGELQEIKARVEELEEKREELLGKRSELQASEKSLSANVNRLEKELAEKREKRRKLEELAAEKLKEKIKKLEEESRSLASEIAKLKGLKEELEKAISELERAGSTCPVCDSPLPESKKAELIQRKKMDAEEVEKKLASCREMETKISSELEELNKKLDEAEIFRLGTADLEQKEKELAEMKEKLSAARSTIPAVEAELSELAKKKEEAEELKKKLEEELHRLQEALKACERIRELEGQIGLWEKEAGALEKRMVELRSEFSEARLNKVTGEERELLGRLGGLRKEVEHTEKEIERTQADIQEIKRNKEMIERWEAEVKFRSEFAGAFRALQQAILKVQAEMRQEFLNEVNEIMNNLWSELYPYGDYTGIRLQGTETDYILQLRRRGGEWVDVEGTTSGGERTIACLTFRIALAIFLAPSLRWIVFDEPTHNLDEKSVETLAKVMRERLPEIVKQIFVITHDQTFETAVSGTLYRFTRDKEADGPTVCQEVEEPYAAPGALPA